MKITDSKSFEKAIRQRRKELKYTQGYISEITGLSVSFLSDLENGKPTKEYLSNPNNHQFSVSLPLCKKKLLLPTLKA